MPRKDSSSSRSRGRPRSPEAGDRILNAVITLLGDRGWEELTMEAVAKKANVGKATVYRRWASREEIVVAALERFVYEIHLGNEGSLRADLETLLGDAARVYRSPQGRLLPALASAMDRHPELEEVVRRKFLEPRRSAVLAVLERAQSRGELRRDADLDLMHDLMVGVYLYRRLFTGGRLDARLAGTMIEAMVKGFGAEAQVD